MGAVSTPRPDKICAAMSQKATSNVSSSMPASRPEADITWVFLDVREVPRATKVRCNEMVYSQRTWALDRSGPNVLAGFVTCVGFFEHTSYPLAIRAMF